MSTNEIHFVPGSYCGCCTCRDMTATLVFLFSFSSIYPLSPQSIHAIKLNIRKLMKTFQAIFSVQLNKLRR